VYQAAPKGPTVSDLKMANQRHGGSEQGVPILNRFGALNGSLAR